MTILTKIKTKLQDPQNKDIEFELVNLLYSQARPGVFASLIVATLIVIVLYSVIPDKVLLGWYGLMLVVTAFRLYMVRLYFIKNPSIEKSKKWLKIFILMTSSAGISWSLAGTLLIPEDGRYQMFIAFMYAGVSGGGVPFFAGSRLACAAYVVPMLLPFSIWLFLQGDGLHDALGFFTLVFLAMLVFSSFRTHRAVYNAIVLKLENLELVNSLSAAKNKMEVINQELEGEIAERKIAEKLLRDSEEQYRLVTDALPVLISYIDTNLNYRFNNKAHEVWFGKPLTEIIGKPVKEILDPTFYTIFNENFEKLISNKQVTYETIMHFRDDEERYVSVTLIPHIQEAKLSGVFSLVSDMTPRINYLATHDALTDLPNRSLFTARFSQSLKRAHRHHHQVALLFLDLDHFKNINDTLGHDIGDHLLIKVVERINGCLREIDTLARLGGDEFIIILEAVTTDDIITVANKICKAVSLPFLLEGRDVFITTSIGISVYPEDGADMQILLKNADMAIYRAKESGRNTFEFYTDELNEKIIKKLTIETNLRSALEKKEFTLYYQPIIDITKNAICGLESLIRWQHPELGIISPIDFIPISEEIGLIVPIGEWILRTACFQNLKWQKEGYFPQHVRVSINISARQFKENNLIKTFTNVLQETGLSGEYLTLELTETLIMQDIEHSARVIKSLKDLGFAISIDDFGTGYSSLNYLRRFPIDFLKIDRSFITDVTINADDASIVTAIIAMAHSLKMKVVAEGVETIDQYEFLKNLHCDEIQGFLFAKPMAMNDASRFLKDSFSVEQLLKQEYEKKGVMIG